MQHSTVHRGFSISLLTLVKTFLLLLLLTLSVCVSLIKAQSRVSLQLFYQPANRAVSSRLERRRSVALSCPIMYMYVHDVEQHSVSRSDSWAATVAAGETARKAASDDEETACWQISWFCSKTTAVLPLFIQGSQYCWDKRLISHWMEK